MKAPLITIFLLLILIVVAGKQKIENKAHLQKQVTSFDFTKGTVKDLIKLLKTEDNRRTNKHNIYFMDQAPIDWIKMSDVAFLMPLIYSNDTSKCLISYVSSTACFNCYSTIGGHAIEMIECYRQKLRFPRSFYSCQVADKQKIKELNAWRTHNWK